jgi:hypothetical protein
MIYSFIHSKRIASAAELELVSASRENNSKVVITN